VFVTVVLLLYPVRLSPSFFKNKNCYLQPQIENEYGSLHRSKSYLFWLQEAMKLRGGNHLIFFIYRSFELR
jgi:hypothetical protein